MKMKMTMKQLLFVTFLLTPSTGIAGEADIVDVKISKNGSTYSFNVTVLHDDQGWDHYANRWDVLTVDGKILGERILAHPHDNEQPFTRSLSGVKIPKDVKEVVIRANDSVHSLGGKEVRVAVPGQ